MGVIALIMAGGRGTRTGLLEEKPLVKVAGKPMIDHVIEAVRNAKKVDGLIVAVSKHTPKTAQRLGRSNVKVVKTPGKDYVLDTRYAIRACRLFTPVLVVSADLPLITAELIDEILEYYQQQDKQALTVMAPILIYKRFGMTPAYTITHNGRKLVPSGINILDGQHIEEPELNEGILVVDRPEVAVNVNSPNELRLAEKFLREKPRARYK